MQSIRPWFVFEYPCLGWCLWCCISVQGRYSFQRSRSLCCWHIIIYCRFPSSPLSSTCSPSNPDFHFHQLIHVAFVVPHGVLAHISKSSAKRIWLRYSSLSSSLWFPKSVVGICFRVLLWTVWAIWYLPVVHLSWRWTCCFLCVGRLSSSFWCRFPSAVRCTHLLSPVIVFRCLYCAAAARESGSGARIFGGSRPDVQNEITSRVTV